MVRVPLTPADRERGERLGRLLREARADRSLIEVATAAGISAETLRKIETGRIPTPAFFTVSRTGRDAGPVAGRTGGQDDRDDTDAGDPAA